MVKKIRMGLPVAARPSLSSASYRGRLLALLVLLLAGRGGWAQTVSTYATAVSVGAYTPVTGTLLSAASTSTTLDSYVGVIPANTIPFAFTYAGNNVSTGTVNVSSNGFVTFGATPATSTVLYTPISSTAAFGGVIAPFALDLNSRYSTTAGQNGELRYSIEGTAPNREFVVQWSNFRPYTSSTTNYLVWNFQVRLAETTNVVSFVYSPSTPVGTGQSGSGAQVGLRGATNADYNNFLINTANPWTAPAPGTSNASAASYSTTLQPAVGQTYTFTPPPACVGAPTAGTAAAATATICAGATSLLSLSGTTVGSGITYQWQSASSSAGPFANISGATAPSYLAAPVQTTYYQAVVTCANGGSPVSATSNVVAVTVTPATYATMPATEGFEATWTTACSGTNSLPSASWRNTPATGDNSWRRNDNGTSAGWTSTSGAYTLGGSNAGGASSSFSARFHSYDATSGALGSFDYYVDLSPAGAKRLTFDYINTSGSDKLNVFLSTDGGATFGTTALATQAVAAAWTTVTVDFTATSATCVLRFQATSDAGGSDIGLDNVSLGLTPGCVAPTSVAVASTSATTATATFYSPTAANGYQVITTPATTTYSVAQPATGVATANLTGLTLNATYTTSVTAQCGNGGTATATSAPFVASPYCNAPATLGGGNVGAITSISIANTSFSNTTFSTPPTGTYYTAYPASVVTTTLLQGGTYSFTVNLSTSYNAVLWIDFDRNNTFDTGEGVQVIPLAGATTGTASFTVPATAALGATGLRLRTRGANSANGPANACTNFASGETQDYVVTIVAPSAIDVQPTALVAPAATTTASCYSSTEAVTVTVRNVGTTALSFATNPLTLTVTVSGAVTQTLTTTVNTDAANGGSPLATGTSVNITLPATLNMTTVGTYTLAVTATVPGDGNTTNDALSPQTRTVAAPVAGTLATPTPTICVSGTAVLTLTGAANGGIQLQSSPDNVTFTDVAGATGATYTTPVLTTTTYYRAQVRCNTGTATSSVLTITVNNPLVATTNSPVSACAGSSATLTATASAGSAVRFFSAATGGTALAGTTAGSYTTPALTASTTYYAEAFAGGSRTAGLASNSASSGTFSQASATDYPLGFAVTQAGTLTSVDVYPTAAGTLTIRLYSIAGTPPSGAATAVAGSDVTITVTAAQVGTRVTVPLNYALTAGDYRLSNPTGALGRYSSYTGTYPLVSADGVLSVKGSYTATSSTSYSNGTYNSFFNLTFTNECVGATRTAIQVIVTPPATATFSYPATGGNCAGSTGTVAATLATGATAGTFTSTTGLTLDATTGAVNLATSTAGIYTVTNTVAASGACGAVTATATITVNPTPARPTLTPTYNGMTTTLTSSAATGNQFYFNGTAIAGATGQSYVVNGSATTYGPYTVVVTNSFGCSSPPSVATVVTTTRAGIAGASLLVYPNPTPTGLVTLELSGFRSATQLAVIDALGRVVRSEALPATAGVVTHQLNLSGITSGVYMLRLTNADGVETRRLVRE